MPQKVKKVQRFSLLPNLGRRFKMVGAAICLTAVIGVPTLAHADQFDTKIQSLQNQNSQKQASVNSLQVRASSYQDAINKLQSQIGSLQSQISANQAKQAQLKQQINDDQRKIDHERKVLGEDVRATYVDGQMSTIEMLATSKNLSDYLDKEEYRQAVQNKIQDTLRQITKLQQQLQTQKTQVDQLLQTQTQQQAQLDYDRAQNNHLLSLNESQQADYNAQINKNNAKIAKLRQEQIEANTSTVLQSLARGRCGGGYPNNLCYAAQDSIVDPWHMLNRECVSYTAWRASQESSIANMLLQEYGFGNATDWPSSAIRYGAKYGVTVSTTPHAGDIAIRPAIPGVYVAPGEPDVGHAMYVESVGSGTVTVSEFNAYLDGTYSEEVRSVSGTYHGYGYHLQFIHFP